MVALNETGGGFRSGNFTIMTEWSDIYDRWLNEDGQINKDNVHCVASSVRGRFDHVRICFSCSRFTSVVNFTAVAGSVMKVIRAATGSQCNL